MAKNNSISDLVQAGFSFDDATALRRISMTLHRWHELECGDSNDYASWCITRGYRERRDGSHSDGSGPHWVFIHDENGLPYEERHPHADNRVIYTKIPDRERGALKRLDKIMARYPGFGRYIQGDPRGCALYILRPDDLAFIQDRALTVDSAYNRGIAVYK